MTLEPSNTIERLKNVNKIQEATLGMGIFWMEDQANRPIKINDSGRDPGISPEVLSYLLFEHIRVLVSI